MMRMASVDQSPIDQRIAQLAGTADVSVRQRWRIFKIGKAHLPKGRWSPCSISVTTRPADFGRISQANRTSRRLIG